MFDDRENGVQTIIIMPRGINIFMDHETKCQNPDIKIKAVCVEISIVRVSHRTSEPV